VESCNRRAIAGPLTGHTHWVSTTGEIVAGPFTGHADLIKADAFSPGGQRIASGSADHTVCVWDATTGSVTTVPLLETGNVLSVAFSPDGQHIVSASGDCTIFMWHAPTGEVEVASSTGQSESVSSATSPLDGNRIASASRDRTIHVENVNTEDIEDSFHRQLCAWIKLGYSIRSQLM
jgi:WD40 repeat protein